MATLKIGRASDNEPKPTQKAKQTWYADAEGKPTTDASKAATHIAEKGQEILPHIASKYGFVDGEPDTKAAKALAKEAEAEANPSIQKAKQTWYVDEEGNPTTDVTKSARQLTEKGAEILPDVAAEYGFKDGDLDAKAVTSTKPSAAKSTAPAENKAADKGGSGKSK